MKLLVIFEGKEQSVTVPDSKKTMSQAAPLIKKALKLEECTFFVDNKQLSDKDVVSEKLKIEVKVPAAKDALKENEEEQYEVEYEYEEDENDSSVYDASGSSYSD